MSFNKKLNNKLTIILHILSQKLISFTLFIIIIIIKIHFQQT